MTNRNVFCRTCGSPTNAYLCRPCWRQLEEAFDVLPGLINDVATRAVGDTHVYHGTRRASPPDPELADIEEEYGWRRGRIPSHLRTRDPRITLPTTPGIVDLDASKLLDRARSTLTTGARHLAESRGLTVALSTGRATEGPVCAPHVHHATIIGCRAGPSGCRSYHPNHVHTINQAPCPDDCRQLHCTHASCAKIRHGELTGTAAALVRWFLQHRDTVRFDEAVEQIHVDVMALRDDLLAAVDSTPSATFIGPCRADLGQTCCARDLYSWPGADEIVCVGYRSDGHGCGTIHTQESRDAWMAEQVQDALIGIDEMLAALPRMFPSYPRPPKSVVQAWVRQGRLMAHGRTHVGEPTFVGGEMLDLIVAYKPHRYAPRPGRMSA